MNAVTRSGGKAAAFFDLDGTLLPEPSLERRFFSAMQRAGAIPVTNYLRWGLEALLLLPSGPVAIQQRNKRYLTGMSCGLASRHLDSITFFEEGLARVVWHAQQGHEIVLVSGTIQELAHLAATSLECELEVQGLEARPKVLATELSEERGRWTGYLAGEAMFGVAKARAVQQYASEKGYDLRECHAYGNSLFDRQLLCAVGHAHAVNPGRDMAALANEKDWAIWHWFQEQRATSAHDSEGVAGIQRVGEQT